MECRRVSGRRSFVLEVVDRYSREYPPDGDGNIHVSMVRLEVEAEKGMG
jgi:hypothetical protein